MNVSDVLFDILIVLVAAKLAAEIAERIGIPAVVGEIVAGVLIGPSVLDLVGGEDVLAVLGEIGVILLLLEVGLEMDLKELGAVGRASLMVAVVGVVAPMALGFGAMQLITSDQNTALFVAAALTATSVGITARVFGDLRALATGEARIVLGAAVADDVIGLVVLTVVVRIVTEGSVSALTIAGVVAVAIGFLLVAGYGGLRLAPPFFSAVERVSRSTGTMVAIALAFTLAFAQLAHVAKLAPIVGAFVAGLALARTDQAERIGRELAPVGHLFIPVFFLQIGIHADVGAFASGAVLRDAAILMTVATVGKLVSAIGAAGTPGDRILIGFGMLPRGEVGLIFATIGLQQGVLGEDLYAALLLVVLATTLATPPLLKMRYSRLRAGAEPAPSTGEPMPAGGWLRIDDSSVVLAGTPPAHVGLSLALEAAVLVANARPSPGLLDWLSSISPAQLRAGWDRGAASAFLEVLKRGNARSWRFLDTLGVLEQAVPELAKTLRDRQADPFLVDPTHTHRWTTIERLQAIDASDVLATESQHLVHPEYLLLAALLEEGLRDRSDKVTLARQVVRRLDLGAAAEQEVALLVGDSGLLWSVAAQTAGLSEESVLALSSHLDSPEVARALYLLSMANAETHHRWEVDRLNELNELIQLALANPSLTGLEARNLVGRRRAEAIRLVGAEPGIIERIETAPRVYVLLESSDGLARQATLLETLPSTRNAVRAQVVDEGGGLWCAEFALHDRPGLLAAVTGVLANAGLDVQSAAIATWPDGAALESFRVAAERGPAAPRLLYDVENALDEPLASLPIPEASVTFDGVVSPWHTVCEVRAPDKPGLLHALATGFAAAEVSVHSARIANEDGLAVDRFEVTDRDGHKLDSAREAAVIAFIAGGVTTRRRRFGVGRRRNQSAVSDPSLVPSP